MMNLQEMMDIDAQHFLPVYGKRTPVAFTHGEGITLYDTEGRAYKDFYAGVAVNCLGYGHAKLTAAICDQASKLIHCSNTYYVGVQAELEQRLAAITPFTRMFFQNSGAEANEAAIKLTRAYFKGIGRPDKYEIITLVDSFHGRTLTTATATGQPKYNAPFAPLPQGFSHIPRNDFDALKAALTPHTCAIMMEPVQGESGINPLQAEFVQNVRKLCDENGYILIFDEIQTGVGRTGTFLACEHFGVTPDILTLAKGLGGGVPIGAMLANETVGNGMGAGMHGTTFGGNPLACRAALAVLEVLIDDGVMAESASTGAYLKEKLTTLASGNDKIKEVRGLGLMLGIELSEPTAAAVKLALMEKGFLVGSIGTSVLRVVPPLIVSPADCDLLVEALVSVL